MSFTRNPGRVAGLWYLLLTIVGPVRLIIIPSKLIVSGNAAATAANIAAHERLFRFGIASELISAMVLIFLTLAFYRLFRGVDPQLAALVVILGGVMPALMYLVNVVNDLGALTAAQGGGFLSAFDRPQQEALASLFLRLFDHTNTSAEILWGAWLLPLGVVVYKSRFVPRFLGVWLIAAGLGYLLLCFTGVFAPSHQTQVFTYSQLAFFGEIALMLWLLIRGAKPPSPEAAQV